MIFLDWKKKNPKSAEPRIILTKTLFSVFLDNPNTYYERCHPTTTPWLRDNSISFMGGIAPYYHFWFKFHIMIWRPALHPAKHLALSWSEISSIYFMAKSFISFRSLVKYRPSESNIFTDLVKRGHHSLFPFPYLFQGLEESPGHKLIVCKNCHWSSQAKEINERRDYCSKCIYRRVNCPLWKTDGNYRNFAWPRCRQNYFRTPPLLHDANQHAGHQLWVIPFQAP